MRRLGWLTALALVCTGFTGSARPIGSSSRVAEIPASPGFPEAIVVRGGLAFVSGPAVFGNAGGPASTVQVYEVGSGRLLREHVIEGEDLSLDHGLSGMAADRYGRLYVASTQLGIVRLWPFGRGHQSRYAPPFPDLAPCAVAPAPCSPAPFDLPALPNDVAFDRAGNLYVTDSFQAVIWRVAPGGGPAEVWFADPRLVSDFGPNGIRLSPDGAHLYFTVTGPPGHLYRLPVVDRPRAIDLEHVAALGFGGPDGIAFAESGNLYVTLAYSNDIVALRPDGAELTRFSGPIHSAAGPIPYDAPAVLAFDAGRPRVIVVNHAIFSGVPSHFVLFDVQVGERGAPMFEPIIP